VKINSQVGGAGIILVQSLFVRVGNELSCGSTDKRKKNINIAVYPQVV